MASGFSGGGHDFYAGRSIPSTTTTTTNNNNNINNINQTQNPYATQIFLDPTSRQIFHHPNSIGKRTLADFQTQHQRQQQQSLNGFFDLRSVKPRMMMLPYQQQLQQQQQQQQQQHLISPSPLVFDSQRHDFPLLQQQQFRNYSHLPMINQAFPSAMYAARGEGRGGEERGYDSENKMMNQLQELEKQLLDDNDDEGGDAVSVITNTNSEWSETIQNIMGSSSTYSSPTQISPSPTSSSSSSSSASVTTPAPSVCSKQSLLEAASAISEGKTDVASEILTRVSQASNRRGTSEQRLMEYMGLALKSRLNPAEAPPPVAELYTKEHVDSTQSLYELSPCFKLGFMAANQAILESTQQLNAFHVVDFDIGQGGQYMNLLHALSSRAKPAPRLSITAVADTTGGEEKERLMGVGDVLSQLAQRVGVSLQFRVVSCCSKLSDLSRESLGCDPDEALVVNFAFKLYRMPDESVSTENPRDELLRRVKGLGPLVVTLVEQEMNTNTAPFMARVNEACAYYGAVMESIESTVVEKEGVERVRVEEGLGRKLGNSVACEGRERVERCEVFGKWRARMGMAGFQLKELSQNVAESMKTRLSSTNRINPGFCVKEENGGVCFGWMGKTLTVASAWR